MAVSVVIDSNSVLTVGGTAITCATEIEFNNPYAVFRSACDGSPVVQDFGTSGGSLTVELARLLSNAQITALAPGAQSTPQALVFQPAGATSTAQDVDATNIEFTDQIVRYSRTGVATMVCPFVLTGLAYSEVA